MNDRSAYYDEVISITEQQGPAAADEWMEKHEITKTSEHPLFQETEPIEIP